MAHSHYVMDLFYPLRPGSDQFRREVLRLDAADDDAAIAEAKRIDTWRHTTYYQLRAIRTSSRNDDRLIYETQPKPAEVAADTGSAETAK